MLNIGGLSRLVWIFLALTMLMHLIKPVDLLAQQALARKLDLMVRNAHVNGGISSDPHKARQHCGSLWET
jgi:hypothetical protein